MKERDKRRRGIATDNASGIDCVQFMEYAASFRWREVEDFFPQDQEAFSYTQLELRWLPQQDDAMPRCYGSCSGDTSNVPMCHPEWSKSKETLESLRANRELELVRRYGFTRRQAAYFVVKQQEILAREDAKEKAAIKKREERKRRLAGDAGPLPQTDTLVPLTNEPTLQVEPELIRAMSKQRKITLAKRKAEQEALDKARIQGLEVEASRVFETDALRYEENLKILRDLEKKYPYSAAQFKKLFNL